MPQKCSISDYINKKRYCSAACNGSSEPINVVDSGANDKLATINLSLLNISKTADNPATTNDSGVPLLAIRDDILSTLPQADGDYTQLRVDSTGALHVTGGGGGTEYIAGTDTYSEGVTVVKTAGVVRKDIAGTLVNTDNEISALQVDSDGFLRVVLPTSLGTEGNLWLNEIGLTPNSTSSVFEVKYAKHIDIFGEVNNDCTLQVEFSQNNTDFYKTNYSYVVNNFAQTNDGIFHISFTCAAQYLRLRLVSNTNIDITATATGKP